MMRMVSNPSPAPQAATVTLERLRPRLGRLARAIVRDEQLAEDVVQEVAIELIARPAELRDQGHLEAWLWRTTKHRAIDALRRRQRRPEVLPDRAIEAIEAACREHDEEPLDALETCVQALAPTSKQLVRLRYSEQLSGKQIAQRVRRKATAVYAALARIHRQLATCVERALGGAR